MRKSKRLCLIVDDQEFDRTMMRRVFAREYPDFPMIIARDIAEARQRLREKPISIIFLDNALPDGMGVDFAREVAQTKEFGQVPVVIVSDFPSPFMYAKARAANVREVWSKREFVGAAIQRVMRHHAILS